MAKAHKASHRSEKPTERTDEILSALRSQGFRITNVRRSLIGIFGETQGPLSVLDLLAALAQQKLVVNKTTVYRELEFLLGNNLITEVDLLDGLKRYELVQHGHHHHHLVCTSCQGIQCIEVKNDLDTLERAISKSHKFTVTSHVLEFFGVCQKCNKGSEANRS
jgi:Fe2+ or Zn2+ uptake regulation protein